MGVLQIQSDPVHRRALLLEADRAVGVGVGEGHVSERGAGEVGTTQVGAGEVDAGQGRACRLTTPPTGRRST